jgi:uncharacterized membrane protein YdbT with pleckstrin-like domain
MSEAEQAGADDHSARDEVLYRANPAMFKNHPVLFVGSVILIPAAGLGLLILLAWYLNAKMTEVSINAQGTLVRRGILSKSHKDVWHRDVRSVYVQQTLFDRMFGVGRVQLFTAGDAPEVDVSGIPDPLRVRQLIYDNANL